MPTKSRLCIVSLLLIFATISADAFTSREVGLLNRRSGLRLAGTLTLPDDNRPKALIVTATGSGTQDRDETIFGKKPFKAVAEYLSDRGYAVLRMDDRGAGDSEAGDLASATTFDFATDIATALAAADSILGFDTPKGVFGHSEGGLIAEHLAATCSDVDFIITYGAPAFRGDSILMRQVRETMILAGAESQFASLYPSLRRRYDIVMAPGLKPIIEAQVLAELAIAQPEMAALPQFRERAAKEIGPLCSDWMRTFLRHDPAADIAAVKVPWLAVNGSIDRQVTPDNLDLIASLCASADTVAIDGLNHIMLKGITGSPDEYARLQGDADPSLLRLIADWRDRTVGAAQSR